MRDPGIADVVRNAKPIVEAIGREAVDVYLFLSEQFTAGPVTQSHVFQFVYRSFYRLDNAGLTPEFKSKYFSLLEESRSSRRIDLRGLVEQLHTIPNRKGHQSLQFSFVTKLANTIDFDYPIYDAEVTKVFRFRGPYNYKPFEARLREYLTFYEILRITYRSMIAGDLLHEPLRIFREMYAPSSEAVPVVKALDFIFWSAGRLSITT